MPNPGRTDDERNESGQFTEKHSDEEFLGAIQAEGGAAGTSAIIEHVGCKYDAGYRRLRRLEDEGIISSQKVANARLWEISDDE